jgi:hypothetical protein
LPGKYDFLQRSVEILKVIWKGQEHRGEKRGHWELEDINGMGVKTKPE